MGLVKEGGRSGATTGCDEEGGGGRGGHRQLLLANNRSFAAEEEEDDDYPKKIVRMVSRYCLGLGRSPGVRGIDPLRDKLRCFLRSG